MGVELVGKTWFNWLKWVKKVGIDNFVCWFLWQLDSGSNLGFTWFVDGFLWGAN
jgi:hypothetical protein